MNRIAANIAEIKARVAAAAQRAGRDAGDVKILAVSKTYPAEALREATECGINSFGENRVHEAEGKISELGREFAEWHLIGHLQSNKARRAVQLFDVIQSLDSLAIAERLERVCEEKGRDNLPILVQLDLAGETAKSGAAEDKLREITDFLAKCKHLRFQGLMLLPPFFDDPEDARPFFGRLREIRDELALVGAFADERGELSMGMSHDFEVAIEEGATIVRIGTAIFGERN